AAPEGEATQARETLARAAWLDAVLAADAAKDAQAALPAALQARLMSDAIAATAAHAARAASCTETRAAPARTAQGSFWAEATAALREALRETVGETISAWRVGGVATAAAAGLALGLLLPAAPNAPLVEGGDALALFDPFEESGPEAFDLFADEDA
ncbi:MAG: hypothetical protein AAGM38_10685, partial [Pseudomonadota bacterium]